MRHEHLKLTRLVAAQLLCSFLPVYLPVAFSLQSSPLLEISYQAFSPGFGNLLVRDTVLIYSDGRFIRESESPERAKSGKWRRVVFKEEKTLDAEELQELLSMAEQSDFLNAQPRYAAGPNMIDMWNHTTITYRRKGGEKVVTISNYTTQKAAEEAKVPPSFLKLARWVGAIPE